MTGNAEGLDDEGNARLVRLGFVTLWLCSKARHECRAPPAPRRYPQIVVTQRAFHLSPLK